MTRQYHSFEEYLELEAILAAALGLRP